MLRIQDACRCAIPWILEFADSIRTSLALADSPSKDRRKRPTLKPGAFGGVVASLHCREEHEGARYDVQKPIPIHSS